MSIFISKGTIFGVFLPFSLVLLMGSIQNWFYRSFRDLRVSENEQWIQSQVKFRMGKYYNLEIPVNELMDRTSFIIDREDDVSRNYIFNDTLLEVYPYVPPCRVMMVDRVNQDFKLPVFTYNRRFGQDDSILFPSPSLQSPEALLLRPADEYSFENKRSDVVIFRGASSFLPEDPLSRLIILEKISSFEHVDAGFNFIFESQRGNPEVMKFLKDQVYFYEYRYILCLEGFDVSSSFRHVLQSNSVAFHPYPFRYETLTYNGLRPDVHFIALKSDASDIEEKYKWCEEHPEEVRQIIKNANEFMKPFLDVPTYRKTLKTLLDRYVGNLVQ